MLHRTTFECNSSSKQMARRRKPLDILSHFFRRKTKDGDERPGSSSRNSRFSGMTQMQVARKEVRNGSVDDLDSRQDYHGHDHDEEVAAMSTSCPDAVSLYHRASLTRLRTNLDKEAEALRLSRHDNPVLQRKLASQSEASSVVDGLNNNNDDDSGGGGGGDESGNLEDLRGSTHQQWVGLNASRRSSSDELADDDLHDIRHHLVRSPPPCMSAIKAIAFDFSVESMMEAATAAATATEEVKDGVDPGRAARMTPLPHVRQSCPMFRPVQRGIFQDGGGGGHRRKQAIDLRPLLSRSSDDVVDVRTRTWWDTPPPPPPRQPRSPAEKEQPMATYCSESAPNSPSLGAVSRRQRHQSNPIRPVTYPPQHTTGLS